MVLVWEIVISDSYLTKSSPRFVLTLLFVNMYLIGQHLERFTGSGWKTKKKIKLIDETTAPKA